MDRKILAQQPHGVLYIDEITDDSPAPPGAPTGRTLRDWREYFAENGPFVTGPTGRKFKVSLDEWKDKPADTRLAIYVAYIDPARVGTKDPHGRPQ